MHSLDDARQEIRVATPYVDLARPSSEGFGEPERLRDARTSLCFVIDSRGGWLPAGTPEAGRCIAEIGDSLTVDEAVESSEIIFIEYSRCEIRVQLNPILVSPSALASLRPRLAVIELPVSVGLRSVISAWETCESGAAAMRRIEEEVDRRRVSMKAPAIAADIHSPSMVPGSYIVSSGGDWFLENDQRLKDAIGLADPSVDAIGYAVRNMGFIKVSVAHPSDMTVALHPRNADPGALKSTVHRLENMGPGRFHVRYIGGDGWVSEFLPDGAGAARKLVSLCNVKVVAKPHDRWHLTPASLDTLSEGDDSTLKRMHQKWRITFGMFTDSVLDFALRFRLSDRLILAGTKRGKSELIFRYIGDGMGTLYSDEYRFNAIGNSVLQQPDKEYGEWVAAAYSEVAFAGVPRLDNIDALIPSSARGPWIRYERLLLPWKLPSGDVLVSMCSRIKSDGMLTRPD